MSTKYSTGRSRRLLRDRDGGRVALTDHAIDRWQARTPHACPVSVQEAWYRGEFIKHPEVARSDGEDLAPDDVRVYRHGDRWGAVFLVVEDPTPGTSAQDAARVVCTVCAIQTFDHGPTRAYLSGHGPHHYPDDQEATQ
jgi:hypothetical protein